MPIVSAVSYTLQPRERNLELAGSAGEGNALANRLLGNGADNILIGNVGDDVLYGGGGRDELIGGRGSDTYLYFDGDGNDTILDEAAEGEIDQLVLAGGLRQRDVSFQRPTESPDDLLLAPAGGGAILVKAFFASPSAGIERIVFDGEPTWEREDLDRLAHAAPVSVSSAGNPGGASGQRTDVVTALSPRMVSASPGEQMPDRASDTAF